MHTFCRNSTQQSSLFFRVLFLLISNLLSDAVAYFLRTFHIIELLEALCTTARDYKLLICCRYSRCFYCSMSIKFYRVLFSRFLLLLSLFIDNNQDDGGSGERDADLKKMGDCKEEIKSENTLWMVVFCVWGKRTTKTQEKNETEEKSKKRTHKKRKYQKIRSIYNVNVHCTTSSRWSVIPLSLCACMHRVLQDASFRSILFSLLLQYYNSNRCSSFWPKVWRCT